MPKRRVRRDVTVGFVTPPDAVARLELTSNEWMQKAGELEAEVERLREELAVMMNGYPRLRRIEEAARAVEKWRRWRHIDSGELTDLRAALEEK